MLFIIINIDDRNGITSIINIDDRSETNTFLLSSISMIGLAYRRMLRVSDLLVAKHNSFYFLFYSLDPADLVFSDRYNNQRIVYPLRLCTRMRLTSCNIHGLRSQY